MAIAFDTTGNASGAAVSSITITSVAIGSGSDRAAFVRSYLLNDTTRTVSSVVKGGSETYTKVRGPDDNSVGLTHRLEMWQFVAPANASNNIVITYSGTTTSTAQGEVLAYSGVDQTTPVDTANDDYTALAAGSTLTLSCVVGTGIAMYFYVHLTGTNTASFGSGTERTNVNSGNRRCVGGDKTGTGTVSVVVTASGSGDDKMGYAFPLNEASGGGGATPRRRALLGVGR